MNNLEEFAEHLLQAKGLGNLNARVLSEMRNDLVSRIENRLHRVIAEHMPQSQRAAFDRLLDSQANDEVVQGFCAGAIPNLAELSARELAAFKETYLGQRKHPPAQTPKQEYTPSDKDSNMLRKAVVHGILKSLSLLSLVFSVGVAVYGVFAGFSSKVLMITLGGVAVFVACVVACGVLKKMLSRY